MKENELIDLFLESQRLERGAAENTLAAYERDLRRFVAHWGQRALNTLEGVDITDYLIVLQKRGLSAASVARALSAIKGLCDFARRHGLIDRDPTAGISGLKIVRPLPATLTIREVFEILDMPDPTATLGLRDKAFLEFLYGTGCRISEAIACRRSDLMPELTLVRLWGKGKKERVVPLGNVAWDWIEKYLHCGRPNLAGKQSHDHLFLSARGTPLTRMTGWRIVKKYCRLAGVGKQVSPHTFRHSFATHLLMGGADLVAVQELLGHADITTTEIYTHLDLEFLMAEHRAFHPREKWK